MTDLTTSLRISLQNSQFTRGLRESQRAVGTFTNSSERELRGLSRQFKNMTGGVLGSFRNELLAIGSGWAGMQIAKDTALLDKNLTRMSQTAGVARSETKALRGELFQLQKDYGVLVDASRQANDSLLQSGLNWAESLQATKAIAPASAVTGANSNVLASGLSVGAAIFDFDLAQVGVATELLDKMTVAGRAGNAELEDLSGIFSRIGGNAKTANLDFDQTLGFIEQLSQIEKQPERLATLADSTLRIFTNLKYQDNVSDSLGINFYGADGNRRETFSIIEDIAKLYKKQKNDRQRDALIAAAFGKTDLDTQRGIKALLGGDAIAGMREITEQTRRASGVIERDLKDALDNGIDQTARLRGALGQAADAFAQPINNTVNKLIKYALDTKKDGGLGLDGNDLLMGGAGVLASSAALYKYGGPTARKLLGKGGRLAGGVAAGKALEAAAGVTPVYVVNMPEFGGSGAGSVIDDIVGSKRGRASGAKGLPRLPGGSSYTALPGETLGGAMSKLSWRGVMNDYAAHWGGRLLGGIGLNSAVLGGSVKAAGAGPAALGVGVAGAAGYGVGTVLHRSLIKGTDTEMDIGRAVAKALAFFGNETAQQALNAELRIKIDQEGRASVAQVSSTNMDMDISGSSMLAP